MEVRNCKNGIKKYREKVYINGKAIISPDFLRKTDATLWKRNKLAERDYFRATGLSFNPNITFKEFSDKWFQEKVMTRQSQRTQDGHRSTLKNHLLPLFEKVNIGSINFEKANLLVSVMRKNGKTNRTINKTIMALKTILNDAVRWSYLAKSPLYGYPELKEDLRTIKFWTKTEIAQFLRTNMNDPLYPLYTTLLNTGLRIGEALGLCWDRIDLAQRNIEITRVMTRYGLKETTKTHKKRIVPINDAVYSVLMKQFKQQTHPVFVFAKDKNKQWDYNHIGRKEFRDAQIRAGFTQFIGVHGLRHTYASQFVMNGGSIYDLQKILGHSEISMTEKYAHLCLDYLKSASNIVSFSAQIEENSPNTAPQENNLLQINKLA